LFTIGTITPLEPNFFNVVFFGEKIGIEDLTFNFPHSEGQSQVDTTPTCIKVQDLDIVCWMLLEENQVRLLSLRIIDSHKIIKLNATLDELVTRNIEALLWEYKDIFAWNYIGFKGIPLRIAQHQIEFDITIPPIHQIRYQMNPNYVAMVK
jgi:hypothetical protein